MPEILEGLLLVAIIVFVISLVIFLYRISIHAVHGEGYYNYDQTLVYSQRPSLDSGTPVRPWGVTNEPANIRTLWTGARFPNASKAVAVNC